MIELSDMDEILEWLSRPGQRRRAGRGALVVTWVTGGAIINGTLCKTLAQAKSAI